MGRRIGRLVHNIAVCSSARDQRAVLRLVKVGSGDAAPCRRVGMRIIEMIQTLLSRQSSYPRAETHTK